MLVKQVLDLLLVDLDLDRVALLRLLDRTVLVAQIGAGFVKLALRYLPEGVDLVTLELEVVALLPLSVELLLHVSDLVKGLVE